MKNPIGIAELFLVLELLELINFAKSIYKIDDFQTRRLGVAVAQTMNSGVSAYLSRFRKSSHTQIRQYNGNRKYFNGL
jgi:hypothetical protein